MSITEIKALLQNAGVVGAGGAGFPTYAKLSEDADLLCINAAECEPLLYTDLVLLQKEMPTVLAGISAVLEYSKIPCALLCVKEHTAVRLKLKDGAKLAERILVKTLPDV
jgi:Na+-translocating ferredoxin:NAD+ oxidoreductase RnfC subunit